MTRCQDDPGPGVHRAAGRLAGPDTWGAAPLRDPTDPAHIVVYNGLNGLEYHVATAGATFPWVSRSTATNHEQQGRDHPLCPCAGPVRYPGLAWLRSSGRGRRGAALP